MKVFIINDKVVLDILHNLTVDDKLKDIVKKIILRYDYSFINYIYSVFSVYTTYYSSITDENSHLSMRDVEHIHSQFTSCNLNVDRRNIFMADVYDIMYSTSDWEKTKYKCFFYEDMFNRLENLVDNREILEGLEFEEIFGILESIFGAVEETIVFGLIKTEDLTSNIIVYTEVNNNCLMIYVI